MRLTLFEISGELCSVALEKVLCILTDPQIFRLPLLRACFCGSFVHQGQVVPLLAYDRSEPGVAAGPKPGFVLVCEAEFGVLGVPADKIVRITKIGEVDPDIMSEVGCQDDKCEINGSSYRLLDLNAIMSAPDFTICRLKG